jgi:hypothetical protein
MLCTTAYKDQKEVNAFKRPMGRECNIAIPSSVSFPHARIALSTHRKVTPRIY